MPADGFRRESRAGPGGWLGGDAFVPILVMTGVVIGLALVVQGTLGINSQPRLGCIMTLSIIVSAICLIVFVGLIVVSRPRAGLSPKFLENGLVQVLYPVFLLTLFVTGAGGLLLSLN